jgi:curved DNA-binding protein CbpA
VHHGDDIPRNHTSIPRKGPRTHQWPTTAKPTPYEIFGQKKSAPYSKKVFYELVKIYHPDLHDHSHLNPHRPNDKVSRHVRLERYRLIVTANNILSDPSRRRAYDLYGAGWDGLSDMHTRGADRAWREEPDNASMNATWEDWERWHQRRQEQENSQNNSEGSTKPQEPMYTSNGGFVIGVLMCIIFGGYAQGVRVGNGAMNTISLRDEKDAVINAAMRQRMNDAAGLSRDDRVENFLRQRDGMFIERCTPYELQERGDEK